MRSKISDINQALLKLHNLITKQEDTIETIQKKRLAAPNFEPLVHDNGISGKVVKGEMVNEDKYYNLLSLI